MKRLSIMLLQLLVSAASLWYVFHDPQKRAQIADALRQADRSWVAAGWLCYSAVEALATVRWQMLLRIQGIMLSWLRALAIVMIGLFFKMFLPSLVGGDAVRLYFVRTSAKDTLIARTVLVVANKSGRQPIDRGIFEWLKVCQHFSCLGIIPSAQFCAQLQQPR